MMAFDSRVARSWFGLVTLTAACGGGIAGEPNGSDSGAGASTAPSTTGSTRVGPPSPAATPPPPSSRPPRSSLYQRLGREAGIVAMIDAILVEELKDPEIASYFAANALTPPPDGRPTFAQLKECMVMQVSAASADPTLGDPLFSYPVPTRDGYACRDMRRAHAGLHVAGGVFDRFRAIAATVTFASGLSATDQQTISDFMAIQKPLVVQ